MGSVTIVVVGHAPAGHEVRKSQNPVAEIFVGRDAGIQYRGRYPLPCKFLLQLSIQTYQRSDTIHKNAFSSIL